MTPDTASGFQVPITPDAAADTEHDWQHIEAVQCARCGEIVTGMYPMDVNEGKKWTGPCPGEEEQ